MHCNGGIADDNTETDIFIEAVVVVDECVCVFAWRNIQWEINLNKIHSIFVSRGISGPTLLTFYMYSTMQNIFAISKSGCEEGQVDSRWSTHLHILLSSPFSICTMPKWWLLFEIFLSRSGDCDGHAFIFYLSLWICIVIFEWIFIFDDDDKMAIDLLTYGTCSLTTFVTYPQNSFCSYRYITFNITFEIYKY